MRFNDKSQANFTLTEQGYLVARNVNLARTGSMEYLGEELGKPKNKIYNVFADADELLLNDVIKSFENTPVSMDHPDEMEINSRNWEDLAIGHISNVRASDDKRFLIGDVIINQGKAIKTIQEGKVEVSLGYDADIEEIDGKLTKVNIRGNHLAIVDEGRCGADCKINLNDGKPKKMAQKQTALQRLFGIKPKAVKATKKFGDAKSNLATRTKKLNDSKADFDVKFKDVEAIVVSPDATDEEKLEAVQELQTVAADLQEEAIAIQEEAVAAVEQAEELAAQVTPADETPVNDATVEEAAAEVAALQEELLEKDAKILELEEQLQALKDKEDQASTLADAKARFPKLVFKDSMPAREIKATAVASTGAYTKEEALKMQDCALSSAYVTASVQSGRKSNVGAKFVGNDNKAKANVPASLRRKEK